MRLNHRPSITTAILAGALPFPRSPRPGDHPGECTSSASLSADTLRAGVGGDFLRDETTGRFEAAEPPGYTVGDLLPESEDSRRRKAAKAQQQRRETERANEAKGLHACGKTRLAVGLAFREFKQEQKRQRRYDRQTPEQQAEALRAAAMKRERKAARKEGL